jgi:NADPH:quinone reductase-like Zn-dependent oxidoreductase
MKAIRIHEKGGPEVLVYEDAPKPVLMPGDALVRVHASSITKTELTWDETYVNDKGEPPTPAIPGHEFSGVVEEVAPAVTSVKPGEEVYGLASFTRDGSAAEFIAIHADDLAPKPKSLDHIQAAAVPLAALTAWQALFSHAGLRKGQSTLIHGGAGGVGTFAVQLANWAGANVITTAASNNHDFVGQLGAHQVIDYSRFRFEEEVSNVASFSIRSAATCWNAPTAWCDRAECLSASYNRFPPKKPKPWALRRCFSLSNPTARNSKKSAA